LSVPWRSAIRVSGSTSSPGMPDAGVAPDIVART
jgi:hypothetical protein